MLKKLSWLFLLLSGIVALSMSHADNVACPYQLHHITELSNNGTSILEYRYDQEQYGIGRLLSIKNQHGEIDNSDDAFDGIIKQTYAINGNTYAVSYGDNKESATEHQSFVHDVDYYNGFMRGKTSSISGKVQLKQYFTNYPLGEYSDNRNHRVDYDKNGNIIQLGEMTLSYDALNNVINVNKAGKLIAEYQYSPLNQRVIKVVDGKKTIFIYDQFGKLIEIITPHSITDIIYLDDQPIAQMVNGSTYYFVNHANTTPMYLLDQQGNESWRANVKPFEIDANGIVEQNLRFPGQYYDEETGFYYNHARFYYPKLAQYLQPETLDVLSGGSFYSYAYADYNPVNVIDITGENPVVVAAPVVGVVKAVWKPITKLITRNKSKAEKAAKQAEAARQTPKAIAEEAQANATGQICAKPSGGIPNNGKAFYRSMSKAEAQAVKETGKLRGGNSGETFFTDSRFKTANKAQDRLSLPNKPEVQMEFRIKNNPTMQRNGNRVDPAYGGRGAGKEYMATNPIEVEIINVQPY